MSTECAGQMDPIESGSIKFHETSWIAKIGVLFVCFVHTLAVTLSGLLILEIICQDCIKPLWDDLPLKWPPGRWLMLGQMIGCLFGGLMIHITSSKITLQVVSLPLSLVSAVTIAFFPSTVESAPSLWASLLPVALFIHGCGESSAQIGVLVYVLEAGCYKPGGIKSRALGALLFTWQLPTQLAPLLLLFIHVQIVKLLIGLLLLSTMLAYSGLPKVPPRHKTHQGHESSLRPSLASIGLAGLGEVMTGSQAYDLYLGWSLRSAGLDISASLVRTIAAGAGTVCITCLAALTAGPGLPAVTLPLSSLVSATAALSMGLILASTPTSASPLPLALYSVHSLARAFIPSLPVAFLLTPSPAALAFAALASRTLVTLAPPALPSLLATLQPFGVFWLHASFSTVGALYLGLVVAPELRLIAKNIK